jgi:hypothetical protein
LSSSESNHNIEHASELKSSKLLRMIGKLAGDKPNLKISFEEFKFSRGKTRYTINGNVYFNVIRDNPSSSPTSEEANKHAKARE